MAPLHRPNPGDRSQHHRPLAAPLAAQLAPLVPRQYRRQKVTSAESAGAE